MCPHCRPPSKYHWSCGWITWPALSTVTVINHADNVLSGGFVGAGEFSLLSGGDLRIIDSHMVHEVLKDGDGAVFGNVGLDKDPRIPCDQLFDASVHDDRVLNMLCTFEEAGGGTSKQEQMGELVLDFGDDVVVR